MSKKIVLLSGLKIFPHLNGGHLRTGGVAKSLARLGHDVKIYSIAGRRDDYGFGEAYVEQRIETRLHEEIHLGLALGLVQALARRLGLPRFWQYYAIRFGLISWRMQQHLSEAELVICDLPYTPPVWAMERQKTWWLLSHNLEHKLLEQGSRLERLFAPWMRSLEARAPQRYKAILTCAPEDQKFFQSFAHREAAQILQVGNGIDPDVYGKAAEERQGLRESWGLDEQDWLIVFSGSHFSPNMEALAVLRNFCRREGAFLRERRIQFLVLGSICHQAQRDEFMIVTGRVPDTVPYFAAADAALNPVVRGSGSNLKIFEYLAARLPVISTGFGLRGTALKEGVDVLVYQGDELKDRLDQLTREGDKMSWRLHAEAVWDRHRQSSDMTELLRQALGDILERDENFAIPPAYVPLQT